MKRPGPLVAGLMISGLACWSAAAPTLDAGRDQSTIDTGTGTTTDGTAAETDDGAAPGSDGAGGFAWGEAAPCPVARFEANGAVVDGELWVLGGFTAATLQVTRRVDRYNPATDTWRAGPDLPGAETHIGVVTVGSDVIVVGGFTGNFSSASRPPTTTAVWRWDASSAQWNPGPPLPTAGAAFASALLGSEVHVAGGLGPDGNTDVHLHVVWDLAGAGSSTWTSTWTTAAPLPDARNHGGGTAAGGRFYAIAGRHSWDEFAGDVPDVHEFDPATGAWTDRAPIPIARSEIAASTSVMPDGRILVIGGSIAGIKPSADVLVYDPTLDAWSALPPLPAPRKGAVATRMGPRIVVTTGSPTSVDPSATTFVGCCL